MELYPLCFKPNLRPVVWGGSRLCSFKGLPPVDAPIGESWEVSAVEGRISIISNGPLTGRNLADVIAEAPESILGTSVARKYKGQLPLLVKFIDAKQDLSIQVHPNDEMAQRVHGKMGKSEMWYVLQADPGSFLYAGFQKDISHEEYRRRVADGTITEVLARHEVRSGDVFYLPAGRVHAICGGILLAEVQQSSDVTYRIFDYNRPGMDGKPRELHTDLAAEAIDFHVEDEYRTLVSDSRNRSAKVVDSPYFSVRVTEMTREFHRDLKKYDSFIISMCLEGDCQIRIRETGDTVKLYAGHSCLIPAAIADYDVFPLNGMTRILDAYINNQPPTFLSFLHFN